MEAKPVNSKAKETTSAISALTEIHRKLWKKFKTPEATVEAFGICSVTDSEAREVYGIGRSRKGRDMSGMLFPYIDPETRRPTSYIVRRDRLAEDEDPKKNRYVAAYGNRPHPYFPPDTILALKDPETVICMVEAQKSVVSATAWRDRMKRKVLPIGISGCWNWHGQVGIKTTRNGNRVPEYGVLPDLVRYCSNRTVYLCPDTNVSSNQQVRKGWDGLGRVLMSHASRVLECSLPIIDQVNGFDDFIAVSTDEEVAQIFDKAKVSFPSFRYGEGKFLIRRTASGNERAGVSYVYDPDEEGKQKGPVWLCSPLEIEAYTRDVQSNSWGRLLRYSDQDGVEHRHALPVEMLRRDGRTEALCLPDHGGLVIGRNKSVKELLATYISVWPSDRRARCVDRPGWTEHKTVYVLHTGAIGNASESIVYQNMHSVVPAFSSTGTGEEWQANVAAMAKGNSRLMFGISCAFAGPLLTLVGEQSGGIHLVGPSSIGKTSILVTASSVWGDPRKFSRTWRTTVNGLEGIATVSNDSILVLDELGQVDAKDAGEAAYMLANGCGKSRAARSGVAKPVAQWTLLFLSAGELSLEQHMRTINRKPTAGQELRMAEIDADAGAEMGVLEELHGRASARAFIEELNANAHSCYGTVGREYLERLVKDRTSSVDFMKTLAANVQKILTTYVSVNPKASSQVQRVARRFALVAAAGELATGYGLTGWELGKATVQVGKCLIGWMDAFGNGSREERKLLEQVRAFFELHGSDRFESLTPNDRQPTVHNRCGFYSGDPRQYLVFPEVFRNEVCAGFNFKFAVRTLKEKDWLEPSGGKSSQTKNLPGIGKTRVYVINSQMWQEGLWEAELKEE